MGAGPNFITVQGPGHFKTDKIIRPEIAHIVAYQHKQEKNGEVLETPEKIYMKFEKPWKIFMGWLNTRKKGLQVVYERGKNDGKLAIHQPGLFLGLAPVVFLDQNSPWVREGSASYDIEDAGIGTFLFDLIRSVLKASEQKNLVVTWKSDDTVLVTFLNSKENSSYFAYKVSTTFDPNTHLPIAMKLFDWDEKLMGEYAYENLEVNVGMNEEFRKQINRHLLKVYDRHEDSLTAKSQNFSAR